MAQNGMERIKNGLVTIGRLAVFVAAVAVTVYAVDQYVQSPSEKRDGKGIDDETRREYLELVESLAGDRGVADKASGFPSEKGEASEARPERSAMQWTAQSLESPRATESAADRSPRATSGIGTEAVMKRLREAASEQAKLGDYKKAAQLLSGYRGEFQAETESVRNALAKQYLDEARIIEEHRGRAAVRGREESGRFAEILAPLLVKGRFEDANKLFLSKGPTDAVADMKKTLADLADLESHLAKSFSENLGKSVRIETVNRPYQVTVKDVKDGRVHAEDSIDKVVVGVRIRLSELSTAEKMRRIGTMGETAQAICKTALTLEQNNVEDAKLYAARADWFKEELLKQIAKIEEETGKSVVASVASSAEKTSSTETEGAAETTTMPSDPAASKTDDTVKEADLKSVAKLRPEHYRIRSKEDFYRALKLTNPDYDLRGYFNTDEKDNFTAVDLAGAKVSDISVLRTLDLEYLNLNGTEVESIEATRRMPLKTLVISGTKVADLSPLQNSRTLQKLNLIGTPVKTLRVLSNVKLEVIGIDPAKFEDPNEVKNLRRIKSLKMVVTPHGEFDMPRFYVKLEAGDFQKPPPADVDIGFPNVFGTLGRLRK